jgi:truncated hemoglobin YjbI
MALYEQLGGEAAVNELMDGLYIRALADPLLAPFLADIDVTALKSRQVAFVCQAIGGPQEYVGSLAEAHARLQIEQRHFDAFAKHMEGALQDLGATDAVISDLMRMVRAVRPVIVNS